MISATGAQIIVTLLEQHGVKFVAGIPGNAVLPLYDQLAKSQIKHILMRHEQGVGFFAQGYARSTGVPAVCIATSGPGATNLLTAVADARADSIPMVIITGQVNTCQIGTDAFQEVDTFGLSLSITKHSVMIKSAIELLTAIPKAFSLASSGRPGPVLIDIPRDVQLQMVQFLDWPDLTQPNRQKTKFHTSTQDFPNLVKCFCDVLSSSKKPVLFLGGGCNSFEAHSEIKKFLDVYPVPVVTSLMGIGSVSSEYNLYLGLVGKYGSYAANKTIHDSDVVLACGVRFDDRATGISSQFCPNAKILHIDIDAAEVNKILHSHCSIIADVESVFPILTQKVLQRVEVRQRWMYQVEKLKKSSISENLKSPTCSFISSIPDFFKSQGGNVDNLIVTTDVGQHQMWTAKQFPVTHARQFLTSGSLGTMGFGLPVALGAAFANPQKRVVCISGDGSILMNIQELATLAELQLNITIIVIENGCLGMIRQQQDELYNGNYSACYFKQMPDFLTIAKGFNIPSVDTQEANWEKIAFGTLGPCLVRHLISDKENVFPVVPPDSSNIGY